ncbi:MAG TPA: TetR family transcriptional regulator [Steroidobacteraceae bacterium]|jgi:TetR/AcrR family transcriptional regulator, transcriptional repressor for nem operon|nr:TetR family transcriptional regulator [Steroidobacteraceae bacterium]
MSRNAKSGKRALTSRGAATKGRIVEAAAELIYAKGAERVSLDEVMEATGTSRSQLYHYFENKDALVREVIEIQTSRILAANSLHLESLDSFEALRVWRDWMIAANRAEGGVGGCPLGSLANELAARSEEARHQLDQSFAAWGAVIEMGLCRMRERGQIRIGADPKAMAVAVLAAIQGGILLSKTARSSQPLELALDMALSHVERYAAELPAN